MKIFLYILIFIFSTPSLMCADVFLDFEEFTASDSTQSDSPNWEYTSNQTNNYPANLESQTSGWKRKTYSTNGTHWFWRHKFNSCYDHIGVDTYGYLKITNHGHIGNALEYVVTGGKVAERTDDGSCVSIGKPIWSYEDYTDMNDIYTGGPVGHPYVYFKKLNESLTARDVSAYTQAAGMNRFSMYVHLPDKHTNGSGGYGKGVTETFQIGIFIDQASTGSHHYFNFLTQGGGWAKMQIEETTNGDNSGNGSTRYIPNMLQTAWQWYLTTKPYAGLVSPPYSLFIDDIEFYHDEYSPQNNETISNISIMRRDAGGWEISFNDKYKNANAYATYELRYSTRGEITNENWTTATPVNVTADPRFYIQARSDGKFQKWWPYYQGVWAPFTLSGRDEDALASENIVYFAIKDISQSEADKALPVDGINGYWGTGKGGREYMKYQSTFEYSKDQSVLNYIKRINYKMPRMTNTPNIQSVKIIQ